MPLHAEALLLQLKALLLSLKALLLPKKGEIHAIVGKNVIFYLFFYKNKKHLITSLILPSARCLCGFPIETSFRERSL